MRIARVDLGRYLILARLGGVYADLDCECLRPIDSLIHRQQFVIGVEPAESAVLNGDEPGPHRIQGIGAGFKPAVLELDLLDGVLRVTEREAIAASRACARLEGLPIGISSGAALHAAMEVAGDPAMEGKLVVAIAASFAERYLSTELFDGL